MDPEILERARSLFYLGLDIHTQGRLTEAEQFYLEALSLAPDRASILTNLGAVLIQQKRYDEAIPHIDKALQRDANDEVAWLNRALYLLAIRRTREALASLDRALALNPAYPEALCHRGVALKDVGRHADALASFDLALEARPGYVDALQHRADVLQSLGRYAEAVAGYRAALESGGDAETLRFQLSSLGAAEPPAVLPREMLVSLFDSYAEGFEAHQAAMQYCAPQAVFDAVSGAAPAGGWDVADLGCGTGLCGELFRPVARTLTGLDLAPNMVRKARERGVYDEVVEGDVVEFLAARPRAFDLVVAADVFIYIGELHPVFHAARGALKHGGSFAFSLEVHDGEGYVVRPNRRYAQSLSYLRACATECGFTETRVTPLALRKEYGRDVDGVIAVLARD